MAAQDFGRTSRARPGGPGLFLPIAAAAAAKSKAESLAGLPRQCLRARGACGRPARVRIVPARSDLPRGQRSEAAGQPRRRRRGKPPQWSVAERPWGRVAGRDTKKVPASCDVGYGNLRPKSSGAAGRGALFYGALFVTRYGVRPGKKIDPSGVIRMIANAATAGAQWRPGLTFKGKRQRAALAELAKGASRTPTRGALPAIASPA